LGKGLTLNNLQRNEEALVLLEKSARLDPKNSSAWNAYGNILFRFDRLDEALKCYNNALEIDSKRRDYWENKGICLLKLGFYEEALSAYSAAEEVVLKDKEARIKAGLGKFDLLHIEDYLSSEYFGKVNALLGLERFDEALKCLDEISALKNLGYLSGKVSKKSARYYIEIIEKCDKKIALNPSNKLWSVKAEALKRKADITFDRRDLEELVKCYDKLLEYEPNNSVIENVKNRLLWRIGSRQPTSEPTVVGGCPYKRFGKCCFRSMSQHQQSEPENCSLQSGTYRNCYVWQIDPR
jgi:tetratricopeptide (TPR) repeat protein